MKFPKAPSHEDIGRCENGGAVPRILIIGPTETSVRPYSCLGSVERVPEPVWTLRLEAKCLPWRESNPHSSIVEPIQFWGWGSHGLLGCNGVYFVQRSTLRIHLRDRRVRQVINNWNYVAGYSERSGWLHGVTSQVTTFLNWTLTNVNLSPIGLRCRSRKDVNPRAISRRIKRLWNFDFIKIKRKVYNVHASGTVTTTVNSIVNLAWSF
jgi:hypothetical protein